MTTYLQTGCPPPGTVRAERWADFLADHFGHVADAVAPLLPELIADTARLAAATNDYDCTLDAVNEWRRLEGFHSAYAMQLLRTQLASCNGYDVQRAAGHASRTAVLDCRVVAAWRWHEPDTAPDQWTPGAAAVAFLDAFMPGIATSDLADVWHAANELGLEAADLLEAEADEWRQCEDCAELRHLDDCTMLGEDWYCDDCAVNLIECSQCDAVDRRDDSVRFRGVWYCDNCSGEYLGFCQQCEQHYDLDDGPSCSCTGRAHVHGYCHKPAPIFHTVTDGPTGPLVVGGYARPDAPVFGVELEVECQGDRAAGLDALADCAPYRDGFLYLKADSSLSDGVEVVSHPATLAAHRVAWEAFPWRQLREAGWRGWAPGTAGIHVHVARSAFASRAHVARFGLLLHHWRADVTRFSGRESARWAPFHSHDRQRMVRYALGQQCGDRYAALNFGNAETLEVRVFRSSLRPATLAASLEFCAALLDYSRDHRAPAILTGAACWTRFIAWAEESTSYPALVARAEERTY